MGSFMLNRNHYFSFKIKIETNFSADQIDYLKCIFINLLFPSSIYSLSSVPMCSATQ